MKKYFDYYGTRLRPTLITLSIISIILLSLLACNNNNNNNNNAANENKNYPSKGEPADQLIAAFRKLHETALKNELGTMESLVDIKYIDKQKKLLSKAKVEKDWAERTIKLFAGEAGNIFNYKYGDAKQEGDWARLDLSITKLFPSPAFHFVLFHRVDGQWKLYNSVFAQKENFATPAEYIKAKTAVPLFIPPVTEIPDDKFTRMSFDKVIAEGANLNGQLIEIEGVMTTLDKANWSLTVKDDATSPNITLQINEEYLPDANDIINRCGKKCHVFARGVVSNSTNTPQSTNKIIVTQVTILGVMNNS